MLYFINLWCAHVFVYYIVCLLDSFARVKRGIAFPVYVLRSYVTMKTLFLLGHDIRESVSSKPWHRVFLSRSRPTIAVLRISSYRSPAYMRKTRSIWNTTGDKFCTLRRCVFLPTSPLLEISQRSFLSASRLKADWLTKLLFGPALHRRREMRVSFSTIAPASAAHCAFIACNLRQRAISRLGVAIGDSLRFFVVGT